MKKKAQAYSLDLDLISYVDGKRWDYRMNKSQIVNVILRYFKDRPTKLDEIIKEYKKGLNKAI